MGEMGAEVVRKMSYVGTEEGAAVSERRGLRIHGWFSFAGGCT